jgi:hypothetical protein
VNGTIGLAGAHNWGTTSHSFQGGALRTLNACNGVIVNDVRLKFVYLRMTWLTPPLLWFEIVVLALVCWCIYRFSKRPGSRIGALRDWLAYIAISVALVVVIVLA